MLWLTVKIFVDGQNALKWTPHHATIQDASVRNSTNSDGQKSYHVKVRYRYRWDGRVYEGDRYQLHPSNMGRKKVEEIVLDLLFAKQDRDNYPIFVNPEKPKKSAIKNSVSKGSQFGSLLLGVFFTLFGYIAFFHPGLVNRTY